MLFYLFINNYCKYKEETTDPSFLQENKITKNKSHFRCFYFYLACYYGQKSLL